MKNSYQAEIIDISLKDKKILKKYQVRDITKRFLGLLKIYTIVVREEDITDTIKIFQENLSNALHKEWYITFHTDKQVIVVFRKKVFYLSGDGIVPVRQQRVETIGAKEQEKWNEMIAYAKSLGVPDNQCDFLPEDYSNRQYSILT